MAHQDGERVVDAKVVELLDIERAVACVVEAQRHPLLRIRTREPPLHEALDVRAGAVGRGVKAATCSLARDAEK